MRKFFSFLQFQLIAVACFGQNLGENSRPIDILPPAPNAASLGRYGGVDFALSSGMMRYEVPLFSYKSAQISLPISLSYTSNGLKVDEIASRVGTSWNLNAGGVVTRTVFGAPDEESQRLSPPPDYPSRTRELIDNFLENLARNDNDFDGQADLFTFNFNGYSGKFILDNAGDIVFLEHSSLKIEKDFAGTEWNFRITTPDGEQYFFGGSSATERTNKSSTGGNCGRSYSNYVPTAWYLVKIVHPNNDIVDFTYTPIAFNYETGISESLYYKPVQGSSSCIVPNIPNQTCVTTLYTSGVLLQAIHSSAGGTVKFIYISRSDIGDKLLSSIEIYPSGKPEPANRFELEYAYSYASSYLNSLTSNSALRYRPFLTKVAEKGPSSLGIERFKFSYYGLNGLPPRLSFAQDDLGYFNGEVNSTSIPVPGEAWRQYFPTATANRSPNAAYAVKGTMSRITYPSGGFDSIVYEGNIVYKQRETVSPPITEEVLAPASDEARIAVYSNPVLIDHSQSAQVYADCRRTSGLADPLHDKATVTVLDENNNIVFTKTTTTNVPVNEKISLQEDKIYRIKLTPSWTNISATARLTYRSGISSWEFANTPASGVRVSKVITGTGSAGAENTKKYIYGTLADPSISSGAAMPEAKYEKIINSMVNCSGVQGSTYETTYYALFSNSINNVYAYGSAPLSYSSVIESWGENFENGGIEHLYKIVPDVPARTIMGDGFLSAPRTSYSYINGKETLQHEFKWINSSPVSVRKIFTSYKEDPRVQAEFKNYVVNKKYQAPFQSDPPSASEKQAYDLMDYSHLSRWIYIDSIRTQTYDPSGQNFVEEVTVNEYANKNHAFITKSRRASSDGQLIEVASSYPQDLVLTGEEEYARQALISKQIISPVLDYKVSKNGAYETVRMNYAIFQNGLVLPKSKNVQISGETAGGTVQFLNYNSQGKLLSQSSNGGPIVGYQWGYGNLYPVAEGKNASEKEFFYEGFEGSGNSGTAHTGDYYYSGDYAVNWLVPNGRDYTISYWFLEGGKWKFKGQVNYSGPVVLQDGEAIDDVIIKPSDAQVATYTYDLYDGLTSVTDIRGKTTYYEYDGDHRLKYIKDSQGNIVNSYEYHFKQ